MNKKKYIIIFTMIVMVSMFIVYSAGKSNITDIKYINVSLNSQNLPESEAVVFINEKDEEKVYISIDVLKELGYIINKEKTNVDVSNIKVNKTNLKTYRNINNSNNILILQDKDKEAIEIMKKTGNLRYIEPYLPYMTQTAVDKVLNIYLQKTGNFNQVEKIRVNLKKAQNTVVNSKEYKQKKIKEVKSGQSKISDIMIFISKMSKNEVDDVVRSYIENTQDFNSIHSVRQYMSTNGIDKVVKKYIDDTSDFNTVAAMLQFMSKEASEYVAEKYYSESEDLRFSMFFENYRNDK
ncbi:hypothetical protein PV797_07295 [Clostridiaceae bacterium M8S5]|nr:hypothetical protein PV797_07295 [Clostridiaceae bacterium M8S5]